MRDQRAGRDRRAAVRGPDRRALPTRQRAVLEFVERVSAVTGEACSASLIARRFDLHPSTVSDHLLALYRKGFLRAPNAPAYPV